MLVSIGKAARILGVCIKTLRRWEKAGKLQASYRTAGNHRRYETRYLVTWLTGDRVKSNNQGNHEGNEKKEQDRTIIPQRVLCYARVSSNKQKGDLTRQVETLEEYCRKQGHVITGTYRDTASGLNDRRPGLSRMLREVMAGGIDQVVVTYPDRLARFGTNIIRQVLTNQGTVLECCGIVKGMNGQGSSSKPDPHRELVDDVVALLTSFAGKLHRMRRGKGKKIKSTGSEGTSLQRIVPASGAAVFPAG